MAAGHLRRGAPALALAALALALGACDTVDLGYPPADVNACRPSRAFFLDQVWPEVLNKDHGGRRCNDSRCHDAGSGRQLVLAAPTSAPAIPMPADWAAVYKAASEQMLCTNVSSSPLLMRPDGRQTHGGGKLFEPDGPEATVLRMWVSAP